MTAEEKLCPIMSRPECDQVQYPFVPCQRERCAAWHPKKDLTDIRKNHAEAYDALLKLVALQEGCYERDAETIIEMRNEEYCQLIERR